MLKIGSKRRRTHQEVIQDKANAFKKEREVEEKYSQMEEMADTMADLNASATENQKYADLVK